MLRIQDIKKQFNEVTVLDGVNLSVGKGDVVAILGPSGSGKTTLLRCINGLEQADSGTMVFGEQTYQLDRITKAEVAAIRRRTSFVFQSYNLFSNKTALQNVTEGLVVARKVPRVQAEQQGMEALDKVGMSDRYHYYPHQLSGGQQQRVAIARAIVTRPDVVFFDEPTSALDPELTAEVLAVMRRLASEGMTMMVVTHEMSFARHAATHVVLMENGTVVEASDVRSFFDAPMEERTKSFLQTLGSEPALSVLQYPA